MSKAQLVVSAVALEGRSKSEVAREYDVSRQWASPPTMVVRCGPPPVATVYAGPSSVTQRRKYRFRQCERFLIAAGKLWIPTSLTGDDAYGSGLDRLIKAKSEKPGASEV